MRESGVFTLDYARLHVCANASPAILVTASTHIIFFLLTFSAVIAVIEQFNFNGMQLAAHSQRSMHYRIKIKKKKKMGGYAMKRSESMCIVYTRWFRTQTLPLLRWFYNKAISIQISKLLRKLMFAHNAHVNATLCYYQWTWQCSHFVRVEAVFVFSLSMPWKYDYNFSMNRVPLPHAVLYVYFRCQVRRDSSRARGTFDLRLDNSSWYHDVIHMTYHIRDIFSLCIDVIGYQEFSTNPNSAEIQFSRNRVFFFFLIYLLIVICFTHYEHKYYSKAKPAMATATMIRTNSLVLKQVGRMRVQLPL